MFSEFIQKIKKRQGEILKITGLFLVWRVLVWIVAAISAHRLTLLHEVASVNLPAKPWLPNLPEFLSYFARFDSAWYLSIVERGYFFHAPNQISNIVFFPLYPILMKIGGELPFKNYLLAGIIISSLATLAACFFVYFLARIELQDNEKSLKSIFLMLIFPYSFFLIAVYSESLFLLLAASCFYFARKKNWLAASLLACLAGASRPTGIILFPVLIFEYFESIKFNFSAIKKNSGCLFLSPLGLILYAFYLYHNFGDPLLFAKAQSAWGRATNFSITLPFKTFFSYLHDFFRAIITPNPADIARSFDFVFLCFFLILSLAVFFKIRRSYGLFMLLSLLPSILTGNYVSVGRFAAVLFPGFFLLAKISGKSKIFEYGLIMAFALFSTIIIVLFVNSNWAG